MKNQPTSSKNMSLNPNSERYIESWNPFQEMLNFQRQFDRFFSEGPRGVTLPLSNGTAFMPACDIEETESHYFFTLDIPGIKKEDIKIELRNQNELRITGERSEEREQKRNAYHQSERLYGAFERSFTLPAGVKAEQIEAHYHQGVLKLTVPKVEVTKATEIKVTDDTQVAWDKKNPN